MPPFTAHPREGGDPGLNARTDGDVFRFVRLDSGTAAKAWVPAFAGMHGN